MGRDKYPKQSLGSLYSLIKTVSRVLMVGAGGIGCELLKNLVLTGFGEIHIVDLDIIDLSNLNRQFLFRHEHIKKSKALVAKQSAQAFNKNVKIEAHHANIKDPQFDVDWFGGFAVVFNALDNLDARRHVNKMCLAADVPLVESGTTGFNGQVQVIKKVSCPDGGKLDSSDDVQGQTECYDCNVKETPKSFPVCTIRSTPSQPIHCIVWAKSYLFTEIFGTSEDDSPDMDYSNDADDAENAEEFENLRKEAQALKRIRDSMGSEDFPKMVFTKVFSQDIERLRSMEDVWKTRKPPEPLDFEEISRQASGIDVAISQQDQTTWTLAENFSVFMDSLRRLSNRLDKMRADPKNANTPPILTFDKDDVDILDFVVASANLRSSVFGIETRSKFDIKQIAGNIIPAIATTNAMTAGLCVLQAFKVLRDNLDKAKMVFLTKSVERVISSEPLRRPRPDCPVCGVAQSRVVVDTSRATLNDLVDALLQLNVGYGEELSISSDAGIIYEKDLEDNLPKKFDELGIRRDTFITVIDEEEENPHVDLVLSISDKSLPQDTKPVLFPQKIELERKSNATTSQQANGNPDLVPNGTLHKRKRAADDVDLENEQVAKRGKVIEVAHQASDQDLVVLDDPGNGAIIIEDD